MPAAGAEPCRAMPCHVTGRCGAQRGSGSAGCFAPRLVRFGASRLVLALVDIGCGGALCWAAGRGLAARRARPSLPNKGEGQPQGGQAQREASSRCSAHPT